MILFLIAIAAVISLSDQAVIVRPNVASDRIDIEWSNTEKLAISIPLTQGQIQKNANVTNGQPAIEKTSTDETVTEEPTTEPSVVVTAEVITEEPSNPSVTSEVSSSPSEATEDPSIPSEITKEPSVTTEKPDESKNTATADPQTEEVTEVKATEEPEDLETESAPTSEPEEEVTGSTEEPEAESVTEPEVEPETEDPEIETEEPTTQSTTTEQATTESTTTTAATTTTTHKRDFNELLGSHCVKTADHRNYYVRMWTTSGEMGPAYPIDEKSEGWEVNLAPHCRRNEKWSIEEAADGVKFRGFTNSRFGLVASFLTAREDGSINVLSHPQTWKPRKNEDESWSFESPHGTWLSWTDVEEGRLVAAPRDGVHDRFIIEPFKN